MKPDKDSENLTVCQKVFNMCLSGVRCVMTENTSANDLLARICCFHFQASLKIVMATAILHNLSIQFCEALFEVLLDDDNLPPQSNYNILDERPHGMDTHGQMVCNREKDIKPKTYDLIGIELYYRIFLFYIS